MFQVAIGFNNVLGLTDLSIEPRFSGIKYPAVIFSVSGKKYRDGQPFAELRWDYLRKADWGTILSLFGLSDSNPSSEVTVRILKNDFQTWGNFNAIAVIPEFEDGIVHERGKFLDVVIVLRNLQEIV